MNKQYQPIACGLYDQFESLAVKREICKIEYYNAAGELQQVDSRFVDLYSKDKEEFAKLENDAVIRLDQITRVNGTEITGSCRIDVGDPRDFGS
ncbi:MAG: hypothetical protein AAF664_01150 [Planctomycetota bacterium]